MRSLVTTKFEAAVDVWRTNPPRCKRRVRQNRRCGYAFYAFYAFCRAREAHVHYRATAVALGGMKKNNAFPYILEGSGGNR